MKHRAEDIAESCIGVREVDNKIRVEPRLGHGRSGLESSLGKTETGTQTGTARGTTTSGKTPH